MKFIFPFLCSLILAACSNSTNLKVEQNVEYTMNEINLVGSPFIVSEFKRVDDSLAAETSNIRYSKIKSMGAFLARIWTIHGKPEHIGYEGFNYTFVHKSTNTIITAYCGGGGNSFGGKFDGNLNKKDQLDSITKIFENEIFNAPLANCEITFQTDYGPISVGAKDGVPFDRMVNQ